VKGEQKGRRREAYSGPLGIDFGPRIEGVQEWALLRYLFVSVKTVIRLVSGTTASYAATIVITFYKGNAANAEVHEAPLP
jgi:hypothetical protein